ncbi:tetratricopeptide repeat protein [Streptococcus merionis]|uniref:tetratricopeptide repeat protein n=1 Tax=Streptococcus merionis TaxID=400065 RepID=UPI0035189BB8
MFSFFKKKEKSNKTEQTQPLLTEEERQDLLAKIEAEKEAQSSLESDHDLANSYEKVGIWQAELEEIDEAIKSLEASLDKELSMGDGYKKLMSLYNQKRAQAAKDRDNSAIEHYMNKMDDMRNIAKKLTLSR